MMFLFRPRPLAGESLSSWRQRCARANALALFPVAPGESRRTDADLSPQPQVIRWLSEMHAVPEEVLWSLTLQGLDGRMLRFKGAGPTPRWVLPLKYSRSDQPSGTPYCPDCLAEGDTPYFRLHWRLATTSICDHHRRPLLDACPACKASVWPASSMRITPYLAHRVEIHQCPHCLHDLRIAPHSTSGDLPLHCLEELMAGTVSLGPAAKVSSPDYLAAVWIVSQLFLRHRSREKIMAQKDESSDLAAELRPFNAKSLEFLPLLPRHRLVKRVEELFKPWHSALTDFCEAHDISAVHFSSDHADMPAWFSNVVDRLLRRQNRSVTQEHIQRARQAIVDRGGSVTKSAVARELGGSHSSLLAKTLGRRMLATEDETSIFIRQLDELVHAPQRRVSGAQVRARNALLLLHACLSNRTIGELLATSWPSLKTQCDNYASRPLSSLQFDALRVLQDLHRRIESAPRSILRLQVQGSGGLEYGFKGFRGGPVPVAGIQRTLCSAMAGLDRRLSRSVAVFKPVLSLPLDLNVAAVSAIAAPIRI